VPRHVARLVTRLVAPLVVDYSASRKLVVDDYFASAARPGASARGAARQAARRAARRRLLRLAQAHRQLHRLRALRVRVAQHVARLVTRLVAPLVVDYSASRRLVIDYSASPRLVVDYSVRRDFVLRPRWLYFIVRRDYLSRGNTGSTSSMPRAATTSSSGHVASTFHLD
jgi:hypothetical protein